ncbi:MAG: hypothetical protein ACYTEP_06025 [Planctomycetota bacterium]|jgi:hypothetical protein
MARKKHLLEVLRAREQRVSGAPSPQAEHSSGVLRGDRLLPAWLLPGVLGAVVLALVFWAGCALFGGGKDASLGAEEAPGTRNNSEEAVAGDAVLAVTYDAARREQALKEARAVRALGYDVQLAQVPGTSNSVQFQLFVLSGPREADLESLLQEIQALSFEGQAKPFAGASIQPLPSEQ